VLEHGVLLPTRAKVLRQATSREDFTMPMPLPGLSVNTSPTNYFPLSGMQMERYDGARWVPFGNPVSG
jgi:branched-chain amino acid transport system substrate-binding protein